MERLAIAKWARIEEYMQDRTRLSREKLRVGEEAKAGLRGQGKVDTERRRRGDGETLMSVEGWKREHLRRRKRGTRWGSIRATRYWNQAEIRRRGDSVAKRQNGEVKQGSKWLKLAKGGRAVGSGARGNPVGPNPADPICRTRCWRIASETESQRHQEVIRDADKDD
jgi:hypothetical protein